MKPEMLVQAQFQEAKVAWGKEKAALQAEIQTLEERVVGAAIEARANLEPGLTAEEKKALEDRVADLTKQLEAAMKPSGDAKPRLSKKAKK